jgi:hypothetical protein
LESIQTSTTKNPDRNNIFTDYLPRRNSTSRLRSIDNNPNHADIEGWPSAKQDQKAIAIKLAASASKLISPPTDLPLE